jgi:hypothetical protein
MKRFTIIGFTEAELGFVLAAPFIVVAVATVHERDASAATIVARQAVTDSLEAAAEAARDTAGMLRERTVVLHDSITALEAKISTKVPQCWEKGEPATAVAEVDVLGANRFRLNGQDSTIDGVRARPAPLIARADSRGCRYIVRARPTAGIDAVQQSAAVWELRRHFDVNDRPR